MLADRTIALAVPFLVTTSQASVVNVPHDGTVDKQVPFAPLAAGVPPTSSQLACKPKNDWDCYKTYYQEYNYCHPYDTWCYKDCSDWNQYKDHCYHKDYDYPCYDKCHYGNDDCEKWKECHSHDHDCYKKKHDEHFKNCDYRDQHCYKNKEPYYKKPEQTPACKPWDWECHKKFHKDHDFECNPWKDKYCYPYYYPEPTCPEKEVPKEPNEDVNLWLYSPCESPSCFEKNGYALKVWPDGDENWTEQEKIVIDHIKYWTVSADEDVRCLPMLSYFPWTPIPLEKYVETYDSNGFKVRVLHLKEPQPVELIRCDFP